MLPDGRNRFVCCCCCTLELLTEAAFVSGDLWLYSRLPSVQRTLCTFGTLYGVLGTLYGVLGTLYGVLGTLYSVLGTLYGVLGTLYSVICTLCTVYNVQCTVYSVHCTLCTLFELFTVLSEVCTVCKLCTLCTLSPVYISHGKFCTLGPLCAAYILLVSHIPNQAQLRSLSNVELGAKPRVQYYSVLSAWPVLGVWDTDIIPQPAFSNSLSN